MSIALVSMVGFLILGYVYFVASPLPGQVITPEMLQTAADIMTESCQYLNFHVMSFRVTDEWRITARFPKYVDINKVLPRLIQFGLVEFVSLGDKPLPEGSTVLTDWQGENSDHEFTAERANALAAVLKTKPLLVGLKIIRE